MDIAAAGAAAAQIATAQRAQAAALSGIKQARVQGDTLANLLSQATSVGQSTAPSAASVAPSSTSNDNQPRPNLPRGSLVNILV